MARTTDKERAKAQELLRDVVVILSDISDIEERVLKTKEQGLEIFKKLDNIADGES